MVCCFCSITQIILKPELLLSQTKSSQAHDVYEICVALEIRTGSIDKTQLLDQMLAPEDFHLEKPVVLIVKNGQSSSSSVASLMTILEIVVMCGDLSGVRTTLERFGTQYRLSDRIPSGIEIQHLDPLCGLRSWEWASDPIHVLEIAKLLMKYGPQATAVAELPSGPQISPLVAAIRGTSLEGVKLFSEHGTNPECATNELTHRNHIMITRSQLLLIAVS
jgi:hypothetical protein